jgi:hypothetical protein
MLSAIEFKGPDKIPVIYHPSTAGLYVHGKKLVDLFNAYPPDNAITFDTVPSPPASAIDKNGTYHEFRVDEWGTEWEYLIFGVAGHPHKYPFNGWDNAGDYRFPTFAPIDLEKLAAARKNHYMVGGWVSIFEQLTKVQPIEEALMDLASEEPAMLRYLDRLVEFWLTEIERMMSAGIDAVQFGDDFGTQDAPIISPAMFRKIFKRHYETLFAPVHKAGGKVFFHSCGHLDEILDELIDLGIDVLWPQSAIFDANPSFLEKCQKNKVALYVHPDRQYLIPLGSPKEIETTIKRYADRYHALGGGGIFHVEMENDAPFENVKALIEAIDRWR